MPTKLLDTSESAERLGKAKRTVELYAKTGKLPIAHKGQGRTGKYLFHEEDVEELAREINPERATAQADTGKAVA